MGRYDETVSSCALQEIFGFEPKIALALMDTLGSASAVFELDRDGLDEMLGPFSKYKERINEASLEKASEQLEKLAVDDCRFLPISSEAYPPLLKECEDPPVGFYYRGISEPEDIFLSDNNIAVVGTRDLSQYGAEWCRRLVGGMAESGADPTIVSGLALGTDITAHVTALEKKVPTIAVMATGIDSVYPFRHRREAERIATTPGCALVTDYPPGTSPVALNFLRRNRIIAGMSRATILIESRIKGGGIMTANLASSYGREVFALPGRADDLRSQGCNHLISDHVADAIADEVQLGKALGLDIARRRGGPPLLDLVRRVYGDSCPEDMIAKMVMILTEIKKQRGITPSELADISGLRMSEVMEYLSRFEADGLIGMDLLQRCALLLK